MTITTTHAIDPGRLPTGTEPATAGWYRDPFELHRMRYHTGSVWTEHVTHFGPTPCEGCGNTLVG